MPTALELVRSVRHDLLQQGEVVARLDGRVRPLYPVAIGINEGEALRQWVRNVRAIQTFETGLGFAIATLFICEGLLENGAQARHVAIDPFQDLEARPDGDTTFAGTGLQILCDAGVRDLVEFYGEESQIALPRLLAAGRGFDLGFIDGTHRFESVFLDLFYAGRLVKAGGVVFIDDTQLRPVSRAVAYFKANLGWIVEDEGREGPEHAWTVLRPGPAELYRRSFTEFVDW